MKYPVYNHLFEIKSPYSASTHENKIYTCIGNFLYSFDLDSSIHSTTILKNFKPRTVSNTIFVNSSLLVIGSYNKQVYLYDKKDCKNIATLQGQQGGVIQCLAKNNFLYVGGRKDNNVTIWDLRMLNSPICNKILNRKHESNQKILFDVNDNNNLIVGNFDGSIVEYNFDGKLINEF